MAGFGFEPSSYGVVGQMPDGELVEFATESEYEDAYYDAAYEYENGFFQEGEYFDFDFQEV